MVWFQLLILVWKNGASEQEDSSGELKSIIVLKLPRSGSTWFTEMMNNLPYMYVSKEIIQGGDKGRFFPMEMEDHLQKALLTPTDKLASRRSWLASSRFREDYWFHSNWKWWTKLQGVGFTLNPEHTFTKPTNLPQSSSSFLDIPDTTAQHLNWSYIFHHKNTQKKYVIVFVRSNLMKMTVSGLLGQRMRSLCGQSNLPITQPTLFSHSLFTSSSLSSASSSSAAADCEKAISGMQINITEFAQEAMQWVDRYEQFSNFLQEQILPRLLTKNFFVRFVYYEDLLRDKAYAMSQLWDFLGIPIPPIPSYAKFLRSSSDSLSSIDVTDINQLVAMQTPKSERRKRIEYYIDRNKRWKKRTSDNLADTIVNYDELVDRVGNVGEDEMCEGLVEQLEGRKPFAMPKDWFLRYPERQMFRGCLELLMGIKPKEEEIF
jgi:hypothetical protein